MLSKIQCVGFVTMSSLLIFLSACSPTTNEDQIDNNEGADAVMLLELVSPLTPEVTCVDVKCEISFSGEFAGQTLISDPLPFAFTRKTSTTNVALRRRPKDALETQNNDAYFGWLIGEDENVLEIYLTELQDPTSPNSNTELFMVEQRAGFEVIGYAYAFLAADTPGGHLKTAFEIETLAGPQRRVIAADAATVRVQQMVYNVESDSFEEQFSDYVWSDSTTGKILSPSSESAATQDPAADSPTAETELSPRVKAFTGAFTRGNGAEDAFYEQLTYITADDRFAPLLALCSVAPDAEAPEYEIFDARYTDHEGYQYDPAFSIRLASQGSEGDIFVEGLSYPLETLDIKASGLSHIIIKSTTEDVAGASWAFGPDGYAFETHGFEEMNVERKIYCADAVGGAEFISNFANTYGADDTTYPLKYSVTFRNYGPDNGGHDTDGMCNYMYDEANQIIKQELEFYNIQPQLQISEAPDNDLRLTITESKNTDPYAKNACQFDIAVDAAWTDNLNPLPERNQNYESGFELIYQGMIQIAESFREHAEKED